MNAERQRIAIAELRGWTLCQPRASHTGLPWISGMNPKPDVITLVVPCDGSPPRAPNEADYGFETLPNYPEDLNACADFEESLSLYEQTEYKKHLIEVTDSTEFLLLHAKPAQRCAAYLRVKGVTEDGE